jgi:hypothetical protein
MDEKNISNFKNITKIIGENKNYVLDIDLDYFVSNGTKLNKKNYFEEPYDVASFDRTKTIIFNENNPRNFGEQTDELLDFEENLKMEIKEIDKRVKKFFKLISSLKNKGYIPSYISICDSTNIEFSYCRECNTQSNGYVPTNLGLYINSVVYNGLVNIFK